MSTKLNSAPTYIIWYHRPTFRFSFGPIVFTLYKWRTIQRKRRSSSSLLFCFGFDFDLVCNLYHTILEFLGQEHSFYLISLIKFHFVCGLLTTNTFIHFVTISVFFFFIYLFQLQQKAHHITNPNYTYIGWYSR